MCSASSGPAVPVPLGPLPPELPVARTMLAPFATRRTPRSLVEHLRETHARCWVARVDAMIARRGRSHRPLCPRQRVVWSSRWEPKWSSARRGTSFSRGSSTRADFRYAIPSGCCLPRVFSVGIRERVAGVDLIDSLRSARPGTDSDEDFFGGKGAAAARAAAALVARLPGWRIGGCGMDILAPKTRPVRENARERRASVLLGPRLAEAGIVDYETFFAPPGRCRYRCRWVPRRYRRNVSERRALAAWVSSGFTGSFASRALAPSTGVAAFVALLCSSNATCGLYRSLAARESDDFGGGQRTRLYPLTKAVPKALVPVAGEPNAAHVLRYLHSFGIDEIAINVHYRAKRSSGRLATGVTSKWV